MFRTHLFTIVLPRSLGRNAKADVIIRILNLEIIHSDALLDTTVLLVRLLVNRQACTLREIVHSRLGVTAGFPALSLHQSLEDTIERLIPDVGVERLLVPTTETKLNLSRTLALVLFDQRRPCLEQLLTLGVGSWFDPHSFS